MAKIIIGREYKDAFGSICRLVEGGCVPPDIVRSADGREIVTDAYTFEYAGDSRAQGEGAAQTMTGEGASWFAALRGEAQDDGTAVWLNLIERVAESYHKRYSLIEYKQNVRKAGEAEKQMCTSALQNIASRFFPELPAVEVREGAREDGLEDIYGVSVRVELSGGTGAAVPALAKVYFRKRGRKPVPLRKEEAAKIDGYLYEVIPTEGGGKLDDSDSSETIDSVLTALDALLYGRKGAPALASCIWFGSEQDRETVDTLLRTISHDNVRLECREVKVLGISHVRWINASYNVFAGGMPVLRATVGLNDSLSLYCTNCGAGALIENNAVACAYTDEDGELLARTVMLDPQREDLGISDEDAEDILQYSEFSKHLKYMSCSENPRREGCSRCVCHSQTENLGTEDDPVYKCKDCPYPEVVFTDDRGVRRYTPRLAFARDKMTMIERSDAQVCDCCGRSFSKESMHGRLCSFCYGAAKAAGGDEERAKRRYRRYAGMFSPFVRMKYAGKPKLCFEEEDVLLFLLGSDRYVFDKLAIGGHGYIAKPRRVED